MLKVIMWLIITVIHNLAYYVDATVKPSSESKNLNYYLASAYVFEERKEMHVKCHEVSSAVVAFLNVNQNELQFGKIGGRYDGQGFVTVK